MGYPLAIFLPEIGIRSETFIRRHVCDLLPSGCIVVTDPPPNPVVDAQGGADWFAPGPVVAGNPGPREPSDPPPTREQIGVVAQILRKSGVQVVLGEYLDFALRWLPLSVEHGFRLFVHGHGVDMTRRLRDHSLRQRYLEYADIAGIIVPSATAKNDLVAIGLPWKRISIVPYGTDVPDRPPERPKESRIRCVAVGRLVPKKSPQSVVTAFAIAHRACPDLRLSYIGDGPLRPQVEATIEDLGVSTAVQLLGALSHDRTLEVIRSSDMLVHGAQTDASGDAEGLPLVILEAMAGGLPVVATDHKGVAEAVLHDQTGLLAPEGDTDQLGRAIVALARSAARRSSFGDAGWRRARDNFSWEQNRSTLLDLLGVIDYR